MKPRPCSRCFASRPMRIYRRRHRGAGPRRPGLGAQPRQRARISPRNEGSIRSGFLPFDTDFYSGQELLMKIYCIQHTGRAVQRHAKNFPAWNHHRTIKLWLHPISGANSPDPAQDSQASDQGCSGTWAAFSIKGRLKNQGQDFRLDTACWRSRSSCFCWREPDCYKGWRSTGGQSVCLTLNF